MFQKYVTNKSLLPFYLSWQLKPNNSNYNLCFSYQLKSDEEAKLLIEKLQKLISLKAYLRQTFSFEEGKLIANIHEALPAEVNFLTSSITNFSQIEEQLVKESHDLHTKSSIRLTIVNFDNSDLYVALFNIHHIIMDGSSLDNFMVDLNQLLANEEVTQEGCEEYIAKIRNEDSIQKINKDHFIEDYLEQVNHLLDNMNFPSAINAEQNSHYTDIMPDYIQEKLKRMSLKKGMSIFNLLLVSQSIFLAKIFNQDCTLINYPVNIRKNKTINGCFVNIVTFPLMIKHCDSYLSLIDSLKEKMSFFKSISEMSFSGIININFLPSFAFSSFAQPHSLIIQRKCYIAKNYSQIASSIISIKYRELSERLIFNCDIIKEILPEYLARSLLSRFFHYLNKLLDGPSTLLSTTDLTFLDEKNQLLYEFNNTYTLYPRNKTIHQLFEEQAEKKPASVALVYENCQLTYSQLNHRANQLAHYLINQYKIKPDDLIGLCLDRNMDMIIAMLAILKTGGAYVSLDPNSPDERIKYILEDTKCKLVLTNRSHDKIPKLFHSLVQIDFIAIDDQKIRIKLDQKITTNIISRTISSNLAHVIYTSGTTGLPKGVMIGHKNVVSLVKGVTYFCASEFDTVAFLSDVTFDAATFEIWGALLNGAKLFIPHNRLELLSDAEKFKKDIHIHQITILLLTKTLFDQLFYLDDTMFSGINYLFVGGEPLNKTLIYNLATSQHKPINLINAYGPTENTTISCTYKVEENEIRSLETIPIGSPLSNRSTYVLDLHQNLLPIGVVGELYVGGAGLSRGYLNQEAVTAKRFIINPFQTKEEQLKNENGRLYKTGDLARLMPDGNIEHIGRSDFQIKIRGYRVELGEIESKLMNYPEIKQVAVLENKYLQNEKIEQCLIAYYISDRKLDELKLRDYLTNCLPDYMLPRCFVHLAEFPRTTSGKLDRKSLPIPTLLNENEYLAPRDSKEKLICQAFSKVFGIEKIGVKEDFFSLGGNSIKAIELCAILQVNFKLTISNIFYLKTPEKIATNVDFSEHNFEQKLEKIKLSFKKEENQILFDKCINKKLRQYLSYTQKIKTFHKKTITNVLLTGATGYLGCNILNQLLHHTNYNVFLLVRSDSPEKAFHRVNKKFQLYFDEALNDVYGSRLFVFPSDIEKHDLDLSGEDYNALANKIDSIIHAAALTKHYGEYTKFYSSNVQATINLLELCQLTKLKDFHYISTVSVLDNGENQTFYTEDDLIENLDNQPNIYIKTKHEAEKQVIKYKEQGVCANIYRVGNLAFISTNFRVQENVEDNAFLNRMKCFITLKIAAQEMNVEEISPVDLTAKAIIELFDKKELSNNIYHVFNPNLCNITDFFSEQDLVSVNILPINDFLDILASSLNKPNVQNNLIMRFLLHQGWLDRDYQFQVINHILQDRTNAVLNQLGFKWPKITKEIFSAFIRKAYFYNT